MEECKTLNLAKQNAQHFGGQCSEYRYRAIWPYISRLIREQARYIYDSRGKGNPNGTLEYYINEI